MERIGLTELLKALVVRLEEKLPAYSLYAKIPEKPTYPFFLILGARFQKGVQTKTLCAHNVFLRTAAISNKESPDECCSMLEGLLKSVSSPPLLTGDNFSMYYMNAWEGELQIDKSEQGTLFAGTLTFEFRLTDGLSAR